MKKRKERVTELNAPLDTTLTCQELQEVADELAKNVGLEILLSTRFLLS